MKKIKKKLLKLTNKLLYKKYNYFLQLIKFLNKKKLIKNSINIKKFRKKSFWLVKKEI